MTTDEETYLRNEMLSMMERHRKEINWQANMLKKLREEKAELIDVLEELTKLVDDSLDGAYDIDSLTTQPAHILLMNLQSGDKSNDNR